MVDKEKICKLAQEVLKTEAEAVLNLQKSINDDFIEACKLLLKCEGRIIVTGIGKSGHIGNKIAATLASTGSPAFFMHPGEASHGDIGVITKKDVVIALSNSGNTEEILAILPIIKLINVPLISMTSNPNSALAKTSNVHLNTRVEKEACPLNLVPTSSTTATLALGDALAIALLESKGFTAKDFARSHPGGTLGKRLFLRVKDLMKTGDAMPKVGIDTTVANALIEVNNKRLGMTVVVNNDDTIAGIFTDGDLRRTVEKNFDIHKTKISDVMTKNCKTATEEMLAAEAVQIMEQYRITSLVIVNKNTVPYGVIHMHDLLTSGLII
jgi:arabinose-5-phosphate isomerase